VILHPPYLQLRTLSGLPPVPDSELPLLVRAQHQRYFRLGSEHVALDAVWLPANQQNGSGPLARAAAASLPVVERIEACAERAGLAITAMGPSLEKSGLDLRLESPRRQRRHARRDRDVTVRLLLAAALVWLGAATLYAADLIADRRAISSELAVLADPLARLASLRTRLDAFEPVASALSTQGPKGAWASESLGRVAAALPDSSHLIDLSMERLGVTRLTARAADPLAVSDAFTQAGFSRPVMEGAPELAPIDGQAWYRFVLMIAERP